MNQFSTHPDSSNNIDFLQSLNLIQSGDQDTEQQNEISLIKIYKQKNSTVILLFRKDLKQLVIQKMSSYLRQLGEQDMLQILKYENITFNLQEVKKVKRNQKENEYDNDNQTENEKEKSQKGPFQQIAGFTDLKNFKLNKRNCHNQVYEMYFFILLDKLNQMHNKRIAHSDIKPQNIAISFLFEPYFIDFDASVHLNQYENYLQSKTRQFNLNKYLNSNDNEQSQCKYKFKNEEEVKLCDRTQLVLTFLFLLCNTEEEKLFKDKNFNDLLKQLYDRSNENSQVFLSFLSSILNEADNSIKIIGQNFEQKQHNFIIDWDIIQKNLFIPTDMNQNELICEYMQQNNVGRIDQFNIEVLFSLYQQNYILKNIPPNTIIFTCPENKEIQKIYEKIKINEIQENLLNKICHLQSDIINLCQYIQGVKKQQCNLYLIISFDQQIDMLVESISISQQIDCFEINLKMNYYDDEKPSFIEKMIQNAPNFYIQSIHIYQNLLKCKVIKQKNKDNLEQNSKISIYFSPFDLKSKHFEMITHSPNFKNIDIILDCSDSQNPETLLQDIGMHQLVEKIQNLQKTQRYFLNIIILRNISQVIKDDFLKNLNGVQNQTEDSQFLNKYGFQLLNSIFEELNIKQNYKITIMIFEMNLDKIQALENISNLLKYKYENQDYQIIFEICKFCNEEDVNQLKEIEKKFKHKGQKQQQQQNINGFRIQFFNQFYIEIYSQEDTQNVIFLEGSYNHQKYQQSNQNSQNIFEEKIQDKKKNNSDSSNDQYLQQIYKSRENSFDINNLKSYSDKENKFFHENLKNSQSNSESNKIYVSDNEQETIYFKTQNTEEKEISEELQQKILMQNVFNINISFAGKEINNPITKNFLDIQVVNKSVVKIHDITEIEDIIDELKNKVHYKLIEIIIGQNTFIYQFVSSTQTKNISLKNLDINIYIGSNDKVEDIKNTFNKFMSLYFAIFDNLKYFKKDHLSLKQNVNIIKKYDFLEIKQNLEMFQQQPSIFVF